MADQGKPFDFGNWLLGSISGAVEGIGGFLGLPSKMFGVPERDPVGETTAAAGLGNTDALRNSLLETLDAQNWMKSGDKRNLRGAISSADSSMLGFYSDELNRLMAGNEKYQKSNALIGDITGQMDSLAGPAITDEQRNKLAESTKSMFSQDLKDTLTALSESFDPTMASKLLAGSEMDARMKSGSELAKTLSDQDVAISKINADTQTERSKVNAVYQEMINNLTGNTLTPTTNFGSLFGTAAGLTDTDIQNQRFQEILSRGDLNSAIQFMSSQAQMGFEDAMSLFSMFGDQSGGESDSGGSGWWDAGGGAMTGMMIGLL